MSTPPERDALSMIDMRELVHRVHSGVQDIAIVETHDFGRALFLDGLLQSAAEDEHLYHEFLVHPAMFMHGKVRRVLVAGAGEGATARELLRHPSVESVVAIDIDPILLEVVHEYLPQWHAGAFDDPRVELIVADVRSVLPSFDAESFDLIVIDLTDPIEEAAEHSAVGPEFFAALRRVLAPGGLVAMQFGEFHEQVANATRAQARMMATAFDWLRFGRIEIPSFNSTWGFAFAAFDERLFTPPQLDSRIRAAGLSGLRAYDAESHRRFALPPEHPDARLFGCSPLP